MSQSRRSRASIKAQDQMSSIADSIVTELTEREELESLYLQNKIEMRKRLSSLGFIESEDEVEQKRAAYRRVYHSNVEKCAERSKKWRLKNRNLNDCSSRRGG